MMRIVMSSHESGMTIFHKNDEQMSNHQIIQSVLGRFQHDKNNVHCIGLVSYALPKTNRKSSENGPSQKETDTPTSTIHFFRFELLVSGRVMIPEVHANLP